LTPSSTARDFTAMLKGKYGNDIEFDNGTASRRMLKLISRTRSRCSRFSRICSGVAQKPKSDRPAVGIVYVEGPIMTGSAQPSIFGAAGEARSSAIRKALDQAAADDNVKAVVLRVDSPGGSATASEIILDATRRVKAKKPFVVSMGNVAGSGGYYVACASDTIFADASTITASIGVVSGKLVTTPMWNKIGVTFKPYARGQSAALFNSNPGLLDRRTRSNAGVHGRSLRGVQAACERCPGGSPEEAARPDRRRRVYIGRQALELGLVDRLGTLNDAIAFVAEKAKLGDGQYDVRPIPEPKKPARAIDGASGGGDKDSHNLASLRSAGAVDPATGAPAPSADGPAARGADQAGAREA